MQRISKDTENKLVRALEKVAGLVNDGETPSDAIIKVASTDDMPIGHVQLMVQAYNNSRFNQQRKSSNILSEKAAHFVLADPNIIYEKLFPSNVKEAHAKSLFGGDGISDEYTRPPAAVTPDYMTGFVKAAAAIPTKTKVDHDTGYHTKKAHSLLHELDVQHAEKRRLLNDAKDKVASAFDDLVGYFKGSYHIPFAEVKEAAVAFHGDQAIPIFDHLADVNPRLLKEQAGHYKVAIDHSKAPYSLIAKCLMKVGEYTTRFNDLGKFSKEAGVATTQLMEHFMPLQREPLKGSLLQHRGVTKQAADAGIFSGPIGDIGKYMAGHQLALQLQKGMEPREPEKLERKSLIGLMDPAHEQRLRGIRAQATFHDIMANDEFMQSADPQHATKLYNEIAKISPRAVDQPLLMRALLRKYLAQGQVDPFEVGQLADLEGRLKDREAPHEPQPILAKE